MKNKTDLGRSAGFSLTELMVVLVIIGIMMLAMVPAIQERTTRKQIEEALPLAEIAKQPIAMAWATGADLPASNSEAGLPSANKVVNTLVSSLEVNNGAINITFGNQAHVALKGKILSLRPAVVTGSPVVPVAWICGYAETPGQMTVKGTNRTNIKKNLLPLACRDMTARDK